MAQKTSRTGISRRRFLNKSAAGALAFTILPSYLALGKEDADGNKPPSKRINLACVGTGGKGGGDIRSHCARGNAQAVALCDVDTQRGGFGNWKTKFPKAKFFSDFRVMLDEMENDIDAVTVGTPDHIHFCATMDAMRRGKHVFCQKPLTHKFNEAELLMQAEKKWNLVTQMGNQGHSSMGAAQFKRMVETGVIRDIEKIEAWKSPGLFFMSEAKREEYFAEAGRNSYPPAQEKPGHVDWDLWNGPCEVKPYSKWLHPFNWRAFYAYGTGMFGDWGAHIIDFAHDYLNLGLPEKIKVLEIADHDSAIFPLATSIVMKFPGRDGMCPVDLVWRDGARSTPDVDEAFWDKKEEGESKPPRIGGAGTLLHGKHGDYLVHRGSHGGTSRLLPYAKTQELAEQMKCDPPAFGCHEAFIQACMGNGKTMSPFSVAAPLTQTLIIGTVCQFLKEDLKFDRKKKRFKWNRKANNILYGFEPRKGYEEFYKAI